MEWTTEEISNLESLLEDAGLEVRRDYSGRGMFGRKCLGVVHRPGTTWIAKIFDELDLEEVESIELLSKAFRNSCQDSMGLNVITYFPEIEMGEEDDLGGGFCA